MRKQQPRHEIHWKPDKKICRSHAEQAKRGDAGRDFEKPVHLRLEDFGFAFASFPNFFSNRALSSSHSRRLATDSKSSAEDFFLVGLFAMAKHSLKFEPRLGEGDYGANTIQ